MPPDNGYLTAWKRERLLPSLKQIERRVLFTLLADIFRLQRAYLIHLAT